MQAARELEVVPFGKYKGQPVERLLSDHSYCNWLNQQPWFREKFGSINIMFVNNGGQDDTPTPEHNAMQIKFLDKVYCENFILDNVATFDQQFKVRSNELDLSFSITFESLGADVSIEDIFIKGFYSKEEVVNRQKKYCEEIESKDGWLFAREARYARSSLNELEKNFRPSDSMLTIGSCFVELKPTIGDDFPCVLRQVKRNWTRNRWDTKRGGDIFPMVFAKQFNCSNVSMEDVVKYFKTENIKLVFES